MKSVEMMVVATWTWSSEVPEQEMDRAPFHQKMGKTGGAPAETGGTGFSGAPSGGTAGIELKLRLVLGINNLSMPWMTPSDNIICFNKSAKIKKISYCRFP